MRHDARSRYPWAHWMNGETHKLKAGTDFDSEIGVFRSYVYGHARRNEIYVKIHTDTMTDTLTVQFFDTIEEYRAARNATKRNGDGEFLAPTPPNPDAPRCPVCGEPVPPVSAMYDGECVERQAHGYVKKHQTENGDVPQTEEQ